jgi:hypothetical protein
MGCNARSDLKSFREVSVVPTRVRNANKTAMVKERHRCLNVEAVEVQLVVDKSASTPSHAVFPAVKL